MSGRFSFGAEELGPTEGGELDDALEAIRALEAAAGEVPVIAGPAFSDRVMGAIADEPSPAPAGFLLPLRRRGLVAGFAESVRQAWASVAAPRPAFARAAALTYVLVVAAAGISVAGAATYGAAGALGLLGPQATDTSSPEPTSPSVLPTPSPDSTAPSSEPTIEPSTEPTESPEPSEGPDDHGGGGGPEPSDDDGSNSGPGGGGGSDDGSGGSDDSEDGGGSGSD